MSPKKTEENLPSQVDASAEVHKMKNPLTALKLKVQILQKLVKKSPDNPSIAVINKVLSDMDLVFDELNKRIDEFQNKFKK